MADKVVILKLEVQGFGAAKTDLEFLTTEATKASEAQRKLNTESRNAAKVLNAEKGSIEALRAETALLRQEEAKLGSVTDANGSKRKALQKQIVANTQAIRDHDRAISGSKTLVGEYENGFIGAFNKIGVKLTAAGAGMAALYGGFKTFTEVLKSTEEGSDLLEQKISGLSTSFNVLKGSVSSAIVELTNGHDSALQWGNIITGLLGPAFASLGAEMNYASQAGEEYAKNLDQLEDAENGIIVLRAKATASIQEARLKLAESNIPAKDRINLLAAALKQEDEAANEEQRVAEMRYRSIHAYNIVLKQLGILKREDTTTEEQAEARIIELRSESARRQLRAVNELKKAKEELFKTDQDAAEYQKNILKENNDITVQSIDNETIYNDTKKQLDKDSADSMQENIQQTLEADRNAQEEITKKHREEADKRKQIAAAIYDALQSASDAAFSNQKNALNEQMNAELSNENLTEQQKVEIRRKYAKEQQKIDIKQAIINGILSIAKTFATLGWPAGIIPAALAAAQTVIQVAAIKAVKYAKGGKIHGGAVIPADKNGDNTLIIAKQGEVVLNSHQQARLGGAATFKKLGVPGFASGGVVGSIEQSPGLGLDVNYLANKIVKGFNDKQVQLLMSDLQKEQAKYNLIIKGVL